MLPMTRRFAWNVERGVELAVLRGHEGNVLSVACSPDGRRIISGSDDRTIRVWDADHGALLSRVSADIKAGSVVLRKARRTADRQRVA